MFSWLFPKEDPVYRFEINQIFKHLVLMDDHIKALETRIKTIEYTPPKVEPIKRGRPQKLKK